MNDTHNGKNSWWQVRQSIAMELDTVLSAVFGYYQLAGLDEDLAALLQHIPADWVEEGANYIPKQKRLISLLELNAWLAGGLLEADYRKATLKMRSLTLETALQKLNIEAEKVDLKPDVSLSMEEQFLDLGTRLAAANYQHAGFDIHLDSPQVLSSRIEFKELIPLLRDREVHDQFWMWLDRLYYEVYRDWRSRKAGALANIEKQITASLEVQTGQQNPRTFSWLPPQNPLRTYPELRRTVEAEELKKVIFWVEPFGLSDQWSIFSDFVIVAFSEPGILYENYKKFIEDVAVRTKALADPTRLTILRMIRQFDMYNTEIAAVLGIARPTVSVHAKILREAGLIESVADGRAVRHRIVPEAVHKLFNDLELFLNLPEEGE